MNSYEVVCIKTMNGKCDSRGVHFGTLELRFKKELAVEMAVTAIRTKN